jgi:hypothetical protein
LAVTSAAGRFIVSPVKVDHGSSDRIEFPVVATLLEKGTILTEH